MSLGLTPEVIGLIGCVLLLAVMFCRLWVGPSMLLISLIGCLILSDWRSVSQILGTVPYSNTASYSIACMPMFALLGSFLYYSDIGADLYYCLKKWIGHIRGGLAIATLGACGFFAAICGNSSAATITMGKVSYPEMRKYGYSDSLASCSIVCGGTVGILIPPSVIFIIYGMLQDVSISKLFMAGVIPGILQVVFYMITVNIMCRIKPEVAPPTPKEPMKERARSLKTAWPVVLIFLFIMGGLYGGLFTATEAGGMGAAAAFIVCVALRRMNKKVLADSVKDTLSSCTMIFFLMIGAYVFMRFMSLSNLPSYVSQSVVDFQRSNNIPPVLIIILIMLVYTVLGCFLDSMAVLLLTVPIITPIVTAMGYSDIWWGVMMVRFIEMSMITPPFGINLFIMSRCVDTPLKTLYKGVWPFLIADTLHVALLIAVPALSLWLPGGM